MQHKLRETLGIVDGKIQARQKPTSGRLFQKA